MSLPEKAHSSNGARESMVIPDVDRYRVIEPLFEGVRVIFSHRGEQYSPAYLQGISGAAFRIAGICPCAPTCSHAMHPHDLIALFGYEYEDYPLSHSWLGGEFEMSSRVPVFIQKVQKSIERNRPVLVWHAFTNAEWDVVCGYDEAKGWFYGRGSHQGRGKYAQADDHRAAQGIDFAGSFGAVFIGDKVGQFDAHDAEIAALREAVAHAHSQNNAKKRDVDKWVFLEGLLCYDQWIRKFSQPDAQKGLGDSYCQQIYANTHASASIFLREIAPKHNCAAHLQEAATHFEREAALLSDAGVLVGWQAPAVADAERNAQIVDLLTQARGEYARAIEQLEVAIGRI